MSTVTIGPKEAEAYDEKLKIGTGSRNNGTGVPDGPDRSSEDRETAAHEIIASGQADLPKAPDGGLQAWLQVLGGFLIYFNTW